MRWVSQSDAQSPRLWIPLLSGNARKSGLSSAVNISPFIYNMFEKKVIAILFDLKKVLKHGFPRAQREGATG